MESKEHPTQPRRRRGERPLSAGPRRARPAGAAALSWITTIIIIMIMIMMIMILIMITLIFVYIISSSITHVYTPSRFVRGVGEQNRDPGVPLMLRGRFWRSRMARSIRCPWSWSWSVTLLLLIVPDQ